MLMKIRLLNSIMQMVGQCTLNVGATRGNKEASLFPLVQPSARATPLCRLKTGRPFNFQVSMSFSSEWHVAPLHGSTTTGTRTPPHMRSNRPYPASERPASGRARRCSGCGGSCEA